MNILLPALLLTLLGGCSLMREAPTVTRYQLPTASQIQLPEARGCRDLTFRVAQMQSPVWLRSDAIHYTDDRHRLYRYVKAQWDQPPRDQLQQLIENAVSRSALFKGVVPYKSLARDQWLLELRVEAMLQTIEAEQSSVELAVAAVLVESYSRQVVDARTFRYRDGAPANAVGAINAWSRQSTQMGEALVDWLATHCTTEPIIHEPPRL